MPQGIALIHPIFIHEETEPEGKVLSLEEPRICLAMSVFTSSNPCCATDTENLLVVLLWSLAAQLSGDPSIARSEPLGIRPAWDATRKPRWKRGAKAKLQGTP